MVLRLWQPRLLLQPQRDLLAGAAGNVQGSNGRSARRQQSADFTKKLTAFRQHTASPARVRERLPCGSRQSIDPLISAVSGGAALAWCAPAVLASPEVVFLQVAPRCNGVLYYVCRCL